MVKSAFVAEEAVFVFLSVPVALLPAFCGWLAPKQSHVRLLPQPIIELHIIDRTALFVHSTWSPCCTHFRLGARNVLASVPHPHSPVVSLEN